jgi:hypothetical protein
MSDQPGRPEPAKRSLEDAIRARAQRRRDRVRADFQRHEASNHTVPTWVFAVISGVILAAFLYVIIVY